MYRTAVSSLAYREMQFVMTMDAIETRLKRRVCWAECSHAYSPSRSCHGCTNGRNDGERQHRQPESQREANQVEESATQTQGEAKEGHAAACMSSYVLDSLDYIEGSIG